MFGRVGIIGVGLIGGSLGACLREKKLAECVTGIGRNEERLKLAVRLGAVDDYKLSIEEGVAGCDIIVIALPVKLIKNAVKEAKPFLKRDALIVDAGSVKGRLCSEIDELLAGNAEFVGCHPIAGKENSGVEAADGSLFKGTKTIITPTESTGEDALKKAAMLWEAAGSHIIFLDPFLHDEIFAYVSHLPHLVAFSLLNTVEKKRTEKKEVDILDYSGGGLRDFARIGGSSPDMWNDISMLNKADILVSLEKFGESINELSCLIKNSDENRLKEFFEHSRTVWNKIRR